MKPNIGKQPPVQIQGEHAKVKELSVREKKELGFGARQRIIQRTARTRNRQTYSIGMALCSLLFPKEFPWQVASGANPKTKTSFSLKTRLKPESQNALHAFYGKKPENMQVYREYAVKYGEKFKQRMRELRKQDGIIVNEKPMNVGIDEKGNFVFFEIWKIDQKKIERYIQSLPNNLRKKQATELLGALKSYARSQQTVTIHQE